MLELPATLTEPWEACLAGTVDPAGARALIAWIDEHPEALPMLRREAAVHLALSYSLASPDQGARLRAAVMARLRDRTAAAGANRPSDGFTAMAMARVRRKPAARPAWLSPLPLLAACAAVLVIALVWSQSGTTTRPAPGAATAADPVPERTAPATPGLATRAATVTARRGVVWLGQNALAIGDHATLAPGGGVIVDDGGSAEIRLADGSVFTTTGASLRLDPDTPPGKPVDRAIWRLERGSLEVAAEPQPAERPLAIGTPRAIVRVVGTAFSVEADAERTWVSVRRGHVALAANGAEEAIDAGREAIADATGITRPEATASRHAIDLGTGVAGFDPAEFVTIPGTFHGLPLAEFRYHPAATTAPSAGFADVWWKASLAPDESRLTVWFHPTRVTPGKGLDSTVIALMAALDDCDYVVAERHVRPDEGGWLRLEGDLAQARINWVRPGTQAQPLTAKTVKRVSFRAYAGYIDGALTGPIIAGEK